MSRTVTQRLIFNLLGYLGLLPFAVSTGLVIAGITLFGVDPRFLFASYSATILSFLGGVLWGRCLGQTLPMTGSVMLLLSNCFALMAWAALLVSDTGYALALVVLMAGYCLAYLAERHLTDPSITDPSITDPSISGLVKYYMKMRLVLTGLVLSAHLLLLMD
jgi:hypothetical protein